MEEVVGDILPPTPPTPSVKEDKLGIGYGILSVVCPIVGWVLWAQWKKETPRRARAAAICGWIGFVVGFIINILSYVVDNDILIFILGMLSGIMLSDFICSNKLYKRKNKN